jgi:AcrR family transcriptional regulator
MDAAPSGMYRGITAEARRSARRERLLDAGLDLLGTAGSQGTSVRAVCRRAGLTTRYFYESFEDLDALLLAVFDRMIEELAAAVVHAIEAAPRDARATAHAAVDTGVRYLTDDPRRARLAFVEALGSEPLMRRRLEAMRMFGGLLAARARDFYDAPPSADALVQVTATMLIGGIAELLITWLDGTLPVTREQLVEDVTELVVATGGSAAALARRRAQRR